MLDAAPMPKRTNVMRTLPAIVMFVLLPAAFAQPVAAAEGLLHVTCAWKKTTDMKTLKTEPMSGTTDFFYDPISDLTGTLTKDGFDHPFVAGTRDNLIEGVSHYQIDGVAAEQRVEINRYTGAIRNVVKTGTTAQALEGTCTRISGPDFGQKGEGQ